MKRGFLKFETIWKEKGLKVIPFSSLTSEQDTQQLPMGLFPNPKGEPLRNIAFTDCPSCKQSSTKKRQVVVEMEDGTCGFMLIADHHLVKILGLVD